MKMLVKLSIVATLFFVALLTSNETKAQANPPRFLTEEMSFQMELNASIGNIEYEFYTAGYYINSISCDDSTGTVMIVEERLEEVETKFNVYLWGLRVFGLSVGYTEVQLSVKLVDENGESYTIISTMRCLVVDVNWGYRIAPNQLNDIQQLPISTDVKRLPTIVPPKD